MKAPEMIGIVMKDLAPLPVEDNLYVLHEGVKDMWTKYNYEHPALIGTYGMLPGDGVDMEVFENTFNKIISVWNFQESGDGISRCWQWLLPELTNRKKL